MNALPASAQLREAMIAAYAVLRERDPDRQWERVATHLLDLLDADLARIYEFDLSGRPLLRRGAPAVAHFALRLEEELIRRACEAGKSLLSTHPRLDDDLQPLAAECLKRGVVIHALLVRADQRSHGAIAAHWTGRERPSYERRSAFYAYWDTVGFALAAARERAQIEVELAALRDHAYRDRLTGLPNALALEEELHRHEHTDPLSVLALDFDGMREANAVFSSYERGGDVLIRAVGRALPALIGDDTFAARLHTAGDEFAVLLPSVGSAGARRLADGLESQLDALKVPRTHRSVYHGASVGWATRSEGESTGQALGRAIASMRRRKAQRRGPS